MIAKKIIFYFISTACIVLSVEIAAFAVVLYLEHKGVAYRPIEGSPEDYDRYLEIRDPDLGWPSPGEFGKVGSSFDSIGARRSPAFSDSEQNSRAYISVYGDSFSRGDEVEDAYAYPNVLASLLNKKVLNFGVGGYGTDQAYLRFLKNTHDDARIVILGHTTENIRRNVNRYRNLLYPAQGLQTYGFKPRFILSAQGELELVSLPLYSYEEFSEVVRSPEKIAFEYFIPGGSSGIVRSKFPYTLALFDVLFENFHLKPELINIPGHNDFYKSNHESNALAITLGIIKSFHDKALAMGKQPLVLVLPTGLDFLYYEKYNAWPYTNLIDALKDKKIELIDAGPLMLEQLNGEHFRTLFSKINTHYNKKGYAMIASIVYHYLLKSETIDV